MNTLMMMILLLPSLQTLRKNFLLDAPQNTNILYFDVRDLQKSCVSVEEPQPESSSCSLLINDSACSEHDFHL